MNRKQKRMEHCRNSGNTITHHHQPPVPYVHEGQMEEWDGPVWSRTKACDHVKAARRERCFITIDDYFIDVTQYMKEHVRGSIWFLFSIPVWDLFLFPSLVVRKSSVLTQSEYIPIWIQKTMESYGKTRLGHFKITITILLWLKGDYASWLLLKFWN